MNEKGKWWKNGMLVFGVDIGIIKEIMVISDS